MSPLEVIDVNRNLQVDIEIVCAEDTFNEEACAFAIDEVVGTVLQGVETVVSTDSSTGIWLCLAGSLVFFMHAGFTILEAGSVRKQNMKNIMYKNVATVVIGAVIYWLTGFGLGFGEGSFQNSFFGTGDFAFDFEVSNQDAFFFFFQFTFAATTATIVSGAVAERITLPAYFIVATVLTGFVFPLVTHWVWSDFGFMSAFNVNGEGNLIGGSIGLIDFAGSGVVHTTGGMIALMGAFILGPRLGRFPSEESKEKVVQFKASSETLMTLGTFILWFGWYGFNPGSTLLFDATNAAKASVTTTLSPCAAGVVATVYSRVVRKYYDLGLLLNCILGGLVAITAGCTAVEDTSALAIGAIGALVYIGGSNLLEKLKIDDPIGAVPVHGFCGIWGVLATGIFLSESAVADSYGAVPDRGSQIAMQFVGIFLISVWALLWGALLFTGLKLVGILRVPAALERKGLDETEHEGREIVFF